MGGPGCVSEVAPKVGGRCGSPVGVSGGAAASCSSNGRAAAAMYGEGLASEEDGEEKTEGEAELEGEEAGEKLKGESGRGDRSDGGERPASLPERSSL